MWLSLWPIPHKIGQLECLMVDPYLYGRIIRSWVKRANLIQYSSLGDFARMETLFGGRIYEKPYVLNPQRTCLSLRSTLAQDWQRILTKAERIVFPSASVQSKFKKNGP